ncbi:MAG: hypothetical protein JST00_02540 [Deltaproteobacteria bacterium]|nr:hypothetical protein [Deltaproteobacteria bacterium]
MHFVADPRLVRRVIKQHHVGPRLGGPVPHARCCVIERAALLRIVGAAELGATDDALHPTVILVARPDGEDLREVWRRAFHGHVHHHLEERARKGELTPALVRERIHRIGQTQFDEIRAVLRSEDLLFRASDDRETYIEFAAFYSELAHFDPDSLDEFFPTAMGAKGGSDVEEVLALDLDAPALLVACKPEGAPHLEARRSRAVVQSFVPTPIGAPSSDRRAPAEREAAVEAARARGNVVRSMVMRLAAGESADEDVDALARRLRAALLAAEGAEPSTDAWRTVIRGLARAAARTDSARVLEARVLFDLQKACIDAERMRSAVDVLGWVGSAFRRPIVRPLPAVRAVRIARLLDHAFVSSHRAALPRAEREQLERVFHAARARAKENTRQTVVPALERAFDAVGLVPRCVPERVARDNLCEELLDLTLARGSFGISQLRDALSRSSLKLPNLTPGDLLRGDPLLRADRILATELDGVYRSGEIYLRGLQKVSSIAFGTRPGRAATLHVVLPLLASFVVLEALSHLVHPIAKALHRRHVHVLTPVSFFALALAVYLLLHADVARRVARAALGGIGTALRAVFVGLPTFLLATAPVRALLRTRVGSIATKPFFLGLPVYLVARRVGLHRGGALVAAVVALAVTATFLATPAGLRVEEVVSDVVARRMRQLSRQVLPGLLGWLVDVFRAFVELVERVLYMVDEWLTFKNGQSSFTLVSKGALGVVWFFATYLIRVYVNVLIEPQVNPIKHFPVVTVSHKIILPLSPTILEAFRQPLLPLGAVIANTIAGSTVFLLPGAFGFLVWELKENWKLYDQNRSRDLEPVRVGHHGETMRALLVAGFHSGTVPKAFAKLRRATKRGETEKINACRAALRGVEHGVRDFVERELAGFLREVRRWKAGDVEVHAVELGSNRICVAISCADASPDPAWIHFEEQSGWLVASVPTRGFLDVLEPSQRATFEAALAGFYKRAGVEIVREQVESLVGEGVPYDVADEGLVVWPEGYQTEVVYDLDASGSLEGTVRGAPIASPRQLDADRLLFARQAIAWSTWQGTFGEEVTATPFEGPPLLRGPR